MIRFSSYNIMTRRLSGGGHVLLNGRTGLMDLIPEELAQYILACGSKALEDPMPAEAEECREAFLERGYLTVLSAEEELEAARLQAKELAGAYQDTVREAFILPSLNCNYRCVYCFEKKNDFRNGQCSAVLTKEQADAIYRYLDDHGFADQITLFGGEPLDEAYRGIVEYIVSEGIKRGRHFYAVTNGHCLDAFLDLLGSGKIDTLQITLDGPKQLHDRRRIPMDRSSSYDRILSNIQLALNRTDVRIAIRINVDPINLPLLPQLLHELDAQKLLSNPRILIYCSPVRGENADAVSFGELRQAEMKIADQYPQFRNYLTAAERYMQDEILEALTSGTPLRQRAIVCGAPLGGFIFSPDGNIYCCTKCIGFPEAAAGQYGVHGVTEDASVLKEWAKAGLEHNDRCLACPYAFLCAGACHSSVGGTICSHSAGTCEFYRNHFAELLRETADVWLTAAADSIRQNTVSPEIRTDTDI